MKRENKRIFINDLPETFTYDELVTNFSKYGQVSSVEIKERKELGPNNKSLFFAYVNLITDDKGINQCFQQLSNTEWHGQYVQLQIARESFLDRLRREREENQKNNQNIISKVTELTIKPDKTQNGLDFDKIHQRASLKNTEKINKTVVKKSESSTESDSDESSELESKSEKNSNPIKNEKKNQETEITADLSEEEENIDIVIKSNRGKIFDKSGLKIPSVGKEPIVTITKTKSKLNESEANLKRLQSIQNMKKSYVAQKSFIKSSLSYGVNKPNTKIVFDDNSIDTASTTKMNGLAKNSLFENNKSDDDSDFEVNFEVKEQFEGEHGQKLLELQSKYKNDKRFALDKRFVDVENEEGTEPMETDDISEATLEAEKRTELKILEDVLGRKVVSLKDRSKKERDNKKAMLRFDPSQPEHSILELTVANSEDNKIKNKRGGKKELQEDLNPEPEVSKEVFYKVTDNLKETFEEKQRFSLLSMFGKAEEDTERLQEGTEKELKRNPLIKGQNPFKYDSSDDENDTEDIPHKDVTKNTPQSTSEQKSTRASPAVFWTEPFFFKPDDFRLQEGLDFIEKIKTENKEFGKIRRDLKGIVKAKVKNNERKNKMFKKKLGGSKRKKHIRIKKALKR